MNKWRYGCPKCKHRGFVYRQGAPSGEYDHPYIRCRNCEENHPNKYDFKDNKIVSV